MHEQGGGFETFLRVALYTVLTEAGEMARGLPNRRERQGQSDVERNGNVDKVMHQFAKGARP
jgi:hypothetical protein